MIRIVVEAGVVTDVHGADEHIVFDWDAFEAGEAFQCPLCGRPVHADDDGGEAEAEHIVETGLCFACAKAAGA